MYAYKFKDIVADPVPALLGILAPLAVLQIAYLTVCLPPTGETPKVKKSKPGEKKKCQRKDLGMVEPFWAIE
jgi:phosphatidylinositol glycan class F